MTTDKLEICNEIIPTGLTENYVSYWGAMEGLREAAQNIAYGTVKSGKKATLFYDNERGVGVLKDQHTGFDKRYLYIGESEQRDDEDGLGNFGEGWKLFLLAMARNNIEHKVETVGYTFKGVMVQTEHNTNVLTIEVEPNDRGVGTLVEAKVSEEEFLHAVKGFAPFEDIDQDDVVRNSVLPGRYHELWIRGVLIGEIKKEEFFGFESPLEIKYAYNLTDRSLMNRDRTKVNISDALMKIGRVVFKEMEYDTQFIENFIYGAMDKEKASKYADLREGPMVAYDCDTDLDTMRSLWKQAVAECHSVDVEKLMLSSLENNDKNKEAENMGYHLIELPTAWRYFLGSIGFPKVDDVIKNTSKVKQSTTAATSAPVLDLEVAEEKAAKVLGLERKDDLPPVRFASELESNGIAVKGLYHFGDDVIYIDETLSEDLYEMTKVLIHEGLRWKTKENGEPQKLITGYSDMIMNLLDIKKR